MLPISPSLTILKRYSLPVNVMSAACGYNRSDLLKECLRNVNKDKKRKDNNIRLVLPESIGKCSVFNDVPFKLIEEAFQFVVKE